MEAEKGAWLLGAEEPAWAPGERREKQRNRPSRTNKQRGRWKGPGVAFSSLRSPRRNQATQFPKKTSMSTYRFVGLKTKLDLIQKLSWGTAFGQLPAPADVRMC